MAARAPNLSVQFYTGTTAALIPVRTANGRWSYDVSVVESLLFGCGVPESEPGVFFMCVVISNACECVYIHARSYVHARGHGSASRAAAGLARYAKRIKEFNKSKLKLPHTGADWLYRQRRKRIQQYTSLAQHTGSTQVPKEAQPATDLID